MKLSALLERNSPNHVPKGRPEKKSQEHVGYGKHEVPERLPHRIINVAADFQVEDHRYELRPAMETRPQRWRVTPAGVASPLQLRQFGAGLGCGDDKHRHRKGEFAVRRNEGLESSL